MYRDTTSEAFFLESIDIANRNLYLLPLDERENVRVRSDVVIG